MGSISPLPIVGFIVVAVVLVGAVAAFVRDRNRFAGYEDLMADALRLKRSLHGEIFRDGADLAMTGDWNHMPVTVRFSHSENTPGLNLRVGVPASFTLSVAPARSREVRGRSPVRTPDELFNARFSVRSDEPTQAKLLLDGRRAMSSLQKLCRTAQTYLVLSIGRAELNDLDPPNPETVRHIPEYLEAFDKLAVELRAMPGAELVKIESLKPERSVALRAAMAVGILAAIAAVSIAARPIHPAMPLRPEQKLPAGISAEDARSIPNLIQWRLASPDDFDADAVGWLRSNGIEPAARLRGNFCSAGNGRDAIYVLVDADNFRRVVMLCGGENIYDAKYPYVGIAARVPKEVFGSIKWKSRTRPEEPDGDGLLLLRAVGTKDAAIILFIRGRRLLTAVPLNYQNLKLE